MKFDMQTCGGCRTCELACSYHHKGVFSPTFSSIAILEKKDGHGFIVKIVGSGDEGLACDGCAGMDEPLCVQYCEEGNRLDELISRMSP